MTDINEKSPDGNSLDFSAQNIKFQSEESF